jgi:TldD protein
MSMKSALQHLVQSQSGYVELRHHRRVWNYLRATNDRVDFAKHTVIEGVGVRVLVDGCWGFAATADTSEIAIVQAIAAARRMARALKEGRPARDMPLARGPLAIGDFVSVGYAELATQPAVNKIGEVVRFERALAAASPHVVFSQCYYSEILEEKVVVTSDGACATLRLAQPELALHAVVEHNGEHASGSRGAGVNGGWQQLLRHPTLCNAAEEAVGTAVDLIGAPRPEGGPASVILAPPVVGLLAHEAVGHMVEADSVQAGTAAQGRIGQRVASELVTLCDTGLDIGTDGGVGALPFDDEGVATTTTVIIERGILRSYLHNRQTAAAFGVAPTGNARAWLFHDEPRVRMRNTCLLPVTDTLEDMIAGVEDGYLADGPGNGQADANGQFLFGTDYLRRIRRGRLAERVRDATMSGNAFEVLATVDAASEDFRWDLGTGYCGKHQPAKVDGGGPYVRCRLLIGGRQA